MNSKTIAFFILVAFLISCQKDQVYQDIINIEQDVELAVSQNVNEFGAYPEIIVTTVDSVNCKNAEFVIEQKGKNDRTEIFINGLANSGICISGKAKPISYINLGNNQVNQTLAFVLKSTIISEGLLEYRDNSIELKLDLPKGIVVKNNTVKKLAESSVWGSITESNPQVIKEFEALLSKHTQNGFKAEIGNYGLFKYFNETKIDILDSKVSNAKSASKSFYFQYQNWDLFIKELKEFKIKYPNAILSLRNFQDKAFTL